MYVLKYETATNKKSKWILIKNPSYQQHREAIQFDTKVERTRLSNHISDNMDIGEGDNTYPWVMLVWVDFMQERYWSTKKNCKIQPQVSI